ncbi:MAG: N-acetylglucosamine-6-phosphate deacetylase [Stomatobaculum sp.]|nr:N-acetylglucosamine-6-phosphate deacetylase [Stomatobaculum sp.]
MLIRNALVYTENHRFEKRDLRIVGDRIDGSEADRITGSPEAPEEENRDAAAEEGIDAEGLYALPGLVDIHLHGAAGFDLFDADPASIRRIAEFEAQNGITAFCPAAMTCGEEKLKEILDAAAEYGRTVETAASGTGTETGAPEELPAASLLGVRLEGPFLSPLKAGAQDPKYIRRGDTAFFREIQERCGGMIRVLDTAPEEPGNLEMILDLSEEVRISVAHTAADYDTAVEAFRAGARQLTHLYNAMPGIHHRAPGPVIAALDMNAGAAASQDQNAGVSAELIADGIHVHPAMVRFTFRNFGPGNMILISDSMRACGLPAGQYELGGQAVTVLEEPAGVSGSKKKKAVLTDHPETLAGSVATLYDCLRCAVLEMGIPLPYAVRAASENPARALGVYGDYGTLSAGAFADIILADKDLNIRAVILKGKTI